MLPYSHEVNLATVSAYRYDILTHLCPSPKVPVVGLLSESWSSHKFFLHEDRSGIPDLTILIGHYVVILYSLEQFIPLSGIPFLATNLLHVSVDNRIDNNR